MKPPAAREIWQEFHWAFFLDTQALILCMRRLTLSLDRHQIGTARIELETAAELMDASAAAMQLAASFTRAEYEGEIRPSMTPPNVECPGFSGLMSWEHGVLVNLWRSLRPRFATLPEALAPAHLRFVEAYRAMAEGHVEVCARFVGEGAQSLRYEDRDAVENLRRFERNRSALIDPGRAAHPEGTP